MGKTWARRPHRRSTKHGVYSRDPIRLRLCCGTSSKDPHRRSCVRQTVTCGDKHPFDTPSEARHHVLALLAKTNLGWRAYECPSCGLWHLTTTSL